jgi:uncharacterized membrane protein YdbT with pleckstrin-like domain
MDVALYTDLLAGSHLFRRVREADRTALAEQAQSVSLNSGDILYSEGQTAQFLYVIARGKIQISRSVTQKAMPYGVLSEGDVFGLECLSRGLTRVYTATALEPVLLMCIDRRRLMDLAEHAPHFKASLKTAMAAQHLIRQKNPVWLEPAECVYHFDYRHPVFLYMRLFFPIIIGLGSILLFIAATEMEQGGLTIAGLAVVLFALAWGVWNYLDYYNDFFVITNKRVVWQEKIIGIYDTRQEAPAQAIRAIDYDASWIGRTIGFGSLSVRTFTGGVLLSRIANAQYIMDLIDEIRQRTSHEQVSSDRQTRRQVLSEQIGLERQQPAALPGGLPPQGRKRAAWQISFKTRLQQGDTIIYRKHWLILLSKTFFPLLLFLGICAVTLAAAFSPEWGGIFSAQVSLFIGAFLSLVTFLWAAYHYFDWRNDIYMVTTDQVYDIERRPLGREEKKSAPLESILSLTVERKNLIGIVFNFGDVLIDAGGTIMIFHNVYDPASAQLDIAARVDGLKRRKEETRTAMENKRMAEWIGEFYELTRK